jgi:transcriptional regulator with XRE-family HTH domain
MITSDQRRELRGIISRFTVAYRENRLAWIILNRADGLSQLQTAAKVGVARPVVIKWEQRFRKAGMAGLADSKGRGRKPWIDPQIREKIVVRATQLPANRSRWSVRTMAQSAGVSKATVQRVWSANDIKPHVVRTFKLSNDKHFETKFWDLIGLYLNPPDRALVLCCDEKSQCQALERTQPSLPLKGGHPCTRTRDYNRHGTTTLFAALSYLDGKIFSTTASKHTQRQCLSFLKQLDTETPGAVTPHLIADNYSTHKHHTVKSWMRWRDQAHSVAGLTEKESEQIALDIPEFVEPFTYVHQDDPGHCSDLQSDNGAIGVNRLAQMCCSKSQRVNLPCSQADAIISDYGFAGKKFCYYSEFAGLFPKYLSSPFPRKKFYGDTQRSYLFKDEFILGRNGVGGRYPFLDKCVVQEFLSLSAELKSKAYRSLIAHFLQKWNYPYEPLINRGYSPDLPQNHTLVGMSNVSHKC